MEKLQIAPIRDMELSFIEHFILNLTVMSHYFHTNEKARRTTGWPKSVSKLFMMSKLMKTVKTD